MPSRTSPFERRDVYIAADESRKRGLPIPVFDDGMPISYDEPGDRNVGCVLWSLALIRKTSAGNVCYRERNIGEITHLGGAVRGGDVMGVVVREGDVPGVDVAECNDAFLEQDVPMRVQFSAMAILGIFPRETSFEARRWPEAPQPIFH